MKFRFFSGLALGFALLAAGCNHLDVTAPFTEDRVLTGLVTYEIEMPLPDDAVVTVRVIDASNPAAPMVLGETTVTRPGRSPIPFRIEYRADDELLMHQIRVEARISIGGKLRFYSVAGHPVTLSNVNDLHVVKVEPADK